MAKTEGLKAQYKAFCSLVREYRTVAGVLYDARDTIGNLGAGYHWLYKHLQGIEFVERTLWELIKAHPCYNLSEVKKYGIYEFCGIINHDDDYLTGHWVYDWISVRSYARGDYSGFCKRVYSQYVTGQKMFHILRPVTDDEIPF